MIHGAKVVVVLPAYNAERTLERTVAALPQDVVDEVLLVDDASQDSTVALARSLGLRTLVHHTNLGYGGNQKTCYAAALALGADVVVMVHPDYQYPLALEITLEALADVDELTVVVQVRDMWDRTLWGTQLGNRVRPLPSLRAGQCVIVTCSTDKLLLGRGLYQVTVACRRRGDDSRALHWVDGAWKFAVVSRGSGFTGLVDLGWRYTGGRLDDCSQG